MKNNVNLLDGPIGSTLLKLLIPQLGGFLAVTAFNFADSWFVSQLDSSLPAGVESMYLSSISLTFPVVFGVGSIAIGLGIAVTTLISRAFGAGDRGLARRITRDALILTVLFTLIVTLVGMFTIDPLFTFMGAKSEQLPLLHDYMEIWYSGAVFMLIPMTCNNVMRGYGNTFWPGVIMIIGAVLNIILDPLLIFGMGFVPALGMKGAAIATVAARVTTAIVATSLVLKWNLVSRELPKFEEMIHEWKEMLFYALPGIVCKVSLPVGIMGITMVSASIGKNALAAMSAGSRIEQLIMMVAAALSMVLMIFITQNLAAGKKDRARRAINMAYKWVVSYAVVGMLVLWIFAEDIAVWFNSISGVQKMIVLYFTIIPLSYPLTSIYMITQQAFFAIAKPMLSGVADIIRFFVIMIPAAWLGRYLDGFSGMILALMVAGLLSSILTIVLFEYNFRKYKA